MGARQPPLQSLERVMHIRFLILGASLLALPAWAQPTATPVEAPIQYRSVFADYRAWREPEPIDWRAANRAAGALGGHMGHVRGHAQDARSTTTPSVDARGRAPAPAAKAEPSK
jgi:hypothetical protein